MDSTEDSLCENIMFIYSLYFLKETSSRIKVVTSPIVKFSIVWRVVVIQGQLISIVAKLLQQNRAVEKENKGDKRKPLENHETFRDAFFLNF